MPVLTPQQISEVNATPFKQKLTGAQLQKFNNLISSENTSPYQVVKTMRQHSVLRDQLPALKSPGCETKHIAVLQADHEKEWQEIQPQITATSNSSFAVLEKFVSDWKVVEGAYGFTGPHIQDANDKIEEIKKALVVGYSQQEENEWQEVLNYLNYRTDLDKVKAIIAHIEKWKAQGLATHVVEADNEAWSALLSMSDTNSDDLISAVSSYRNTFANGALHKDDADQTFNSYSPWLQVKGHGDIFTVRKFICDYPRSLLIPFAESLLSALKAEEIERMKTLMDEYPAETLLALLKDKIFSRDELIVGGVATKESLRIAGKENRALKLPKLKDVQKRCETICVPDRTDIYLFGIPSTGKTCILTGLIGADSMDANTVESAGEYAQALELYRVKGKIPDQTNKGFVATVQASITENDNEHRINLVELAGEDFATKVARKQKGNIEFAQMGKGVPELLANNNRKVFFLIVDPTVETVIVNTEEEVKDNNGNTIKDVNGNPIMETVELFVNQHNSLKAMIDMLCSPINKAVMKKVDAVHFIVTKSDKLGSERDRDDRAYKLFMERYRQLIHPLTLLCRGNGINQHPNKDFNGVPRLFTFSLGKFYPGGYYQYDDADAELLIKVISKCTVAVRPKTIWDRFCDVMNTVL